MAKNDSESEDKPSGKSGKKRLRKFKDAIRSVVDFFYDERTHKVFGLFLLLFSVYLFVAFTSYFFTFTDQHTAGQSDRDLVSSYGWSLLGHNEIVVSNWLGKFGALLADTFIYQWFGVTSLVFILAFFVMETRIVFNARLIPLRKTIGYSFLSLIFCSTLLSFIFHHGSLMVLGGTYGYQMNEWGERPSQES